MTPYHSTPDTQFYVGNILEVLPTLDAESVHAVVTSPPYFNLRDYGIELVTWADGWVGSLGQESDVDSYVAHIVEVFQQVKRVLRKDGTLWLNMGDSYAGSGIGWQKEAGNSIERKWLTKAQHDAPPGYISSRQANGLKPKDLMGVPWCVALALQYDGWWLRSDIIWHKPNPLPESVTDRPTKAHEYLFLLAKSEQYYYDAYAIKEPWTESSVKRDRRGYNGTMFSRTRQASLNDKRSLGIDGQEGDYSGRNKRSVWTIPTLGLSEAYFATFPADLIKPCVMASTSEKGCCAKCGKSWERIVDREFVRQQDVSIARGIKGAAGQKPMDKSNRWDGFPRGTTVTETRGWRQTCKCPSADPIPCLVLDPFGGAGTTALVARQLGRHSLYIDIKREYADMAIKRLEGQALPMKLI